MFLSWGGSEFQRRGAERLNALLPIVVRRAGGTDRCMEEEDLRERVEVGPWRRSDKYGGARLWIALNVNRRILN